MASAQHSLRFNRGRAGDDGLAAAERALQLDPTLAEPHAVKAMLLTISDRRGEAFSEMDRALQLDSESDMVNSMAASLCYQAGRFVDAIVDFLKRSAGK